MSKGPKRLTFWETMYPTFRAVREDCLIVANRPERWRMWSYERLAKMRGTTEDWASGGFIRSAMCGNESRIRLATEFGLWWMGDMDQHAGIRFTACPELGMEWARSHKTAVVISATEWLAWMAEYGATLRPSRRGWFLKIGKEAARLAGSCDKLNSIGNHSIFALLGADEAA